MTRINLVDPAQLTNKHLMAEYREITRPFSKVQKYIQKGITPIIPERYCLGIGHETFFFDKLEYLYLRYQELYRELISRGFNIDGNLYSNILEDMYANLYDTEYWNNYVPEPEDIYLNMSRLCRRSNIDSVLYELRREEI